MPVQQMVIAFKSFFELDLTIALVYITIGTKFNVIWCETNNYAQMLIEIGESEKRWMIDMVKNNQSPAGVWWDEYNKLLSK